MAKYARQRLRRGHRRPRRGASQHPPVARAGLAGPADGSADGRGQGRRLRPRHGAGGPRGPRGRGRVAGAWPPVPRPWPCARRATPAGCCAGWRLPGTDFAPLVAAGIDVTASSLDAARGDRPRRAGGRGDRPAPAEGGHRALAQRRAARRVAGAGHGRPLRAGRRRDPRDRGVVPPRLLRRAGAPGQRRPAARLRGGARPRHGCRARARGATPRQLGGGAAPPGGTVRPGPGGHLRLRVEPCPRRCHDRAARVGPGDDGARDRRTHQGAGGRRRRLLRPHLRGRGTDAGGPGADGVRRRDPAPRLQLRRGACQRRARAGARPDLHGPVRRRGTRHPRRRRGGAVRAGVSRRADRDRVGALVRDDRLRDRHPHGRTPDARVGGGGRSEHPTFPDLRSRRSRCGRAGRASRPAWWSSAVS